MLKYLAMFFSSTILAWAPINVANSAHREIAKPNIVFINVDDLGWADLSYQGSQYYETPNIDKLSKQGIVFDNAYAPAANCAPSRASTLTGQYTPRHGVYTVGNSSRGRAKDRKLIPTPNMLHIKRSNTTIAHVLKSAGYKTIILGKWHVSQNPLRHGFDINIGGNQNGGPYLGGYHSPFKYPNCISQVKGEYLTDRLTDDAITFIKANKQRPFFLYLPYYTVHSPLQPKGNLMAKFKQKPKTRAHSNPAYAAMIMALDQNIGRLMQTLKEQGLADKTVVVFTSDNGGVWKTSKQWPLRAGKGAYYEGGIREPLIIRWPGKIKAGSKSHVPVSSIDFFPTFCQIAGAKIPAGKILDGVNLMPILTGKGSIKKRPLFWHFPIYLQSTVPSLECRDVKFRTRPGSVIRLGRWKLHEYFEDGGLELYDLKLDIGEKNNLAKQNPDKVKELHGLLKAWRKKIKAPVPRRLNLRYVP